MIETNSKIPLKLLAVNRKNITFESVEDDRVSFYVSEPDYLDLIYGFHDEIITGKTYTDILKLKRDVGELNSLYCKVDKEFLSSVALGDYIAPIQLDYSEERAGDFEEFFEIKKIENDYIYMIPLSEERKENVMLSPVNLEEIMELDSDMNNY